MEVCGGMPQLFMIIILVSLFSSEHHYAVCDDAVVWLDGFGWFGTSGVLTGA